MKKIWSFTIALILLSCPPGACAPVKWKELKSDHFIVYYDAASVDFVQNVSKTAEQYYDEISAELGFSRLQGWSYQDRAKIYIYNDQEHYTSNAGHAQWSHGVVSVAQREIHTFPSAHGFFDSTLPHELGHIVFREFVGMDAKIPLWLDEGVAMYQEKAKRWGADKLVKDAIARGDFISVQDLSKMVLYKDTDRKIIDLYYAEAASLTYFIITELGKFRFVNFCRKLRDRSDFENALHSAFPRIRDLDGLNKMWLDHLKK